jgi:hypothetical protein
MQGRSRQSCRGTRRRLTSLADVRFFYPCLFVSDSRLLSWKLGRQQDCACCTTARAMTMAVAAASLEGKRERLRPFSFGSGRTCRPLSTAETCHFCELSG